MSGGATLVAVAGQGGARFLSRARTGDCLVELVDLRLEAGAPGLDQTTNAGGARAIADRIAELARQPGYEHLMLCASPGMMSAIWAHLGDALHDQFVITLSKDVMRETPSEIDCRISRFMKACWPHLDAHRA